MVCLPQLVYGLNEDPSSCDISAILSFLQELLDKGCTPSMLKVYMVAITVNHALGAGQSVGRNNLVIKFWTCQWPLSLKTALLLALALVKHVGDMQELLVGASCLEFGPNDCKVILKPRHGYVPKVLSTSFRVQVITLLALPTSEDVQGPQNVCEAL